MQAPYLVPHNKNNTTCSVTSIGTERLHDDSNLTRPCRDALVENCANRFRYGQECADGLGVASYLLVASGNGFSRVTKRNRAIDNHALSLMTNDRKMQELATRPPTTPNSERGENAFT